jgi:hypothetical protein
MVDILLYCHHVVDTTFVGIVASAIHMLLRVILVIASGIGTGKENRLFRQRPAEGILRARGWDETPPGKDSSH